MLDSDEFIYSCEEELKEAMRMQVEGVVKKYFQRGQNTSLVIDDGNSEEWYGFGKFPPKVSEGDTVRFEFSVNGKYKNGDARTVEVVSSAPPTQNANSFPAKGKDDYWEKRFERDLVNDKLYNIRASTMAAKDIVLGQAGEYKLTKTSTPKLLAQIEAVADMILTSWNNRADSVSAEMEVADDEETGWVDVD